MFSPLEQLYFSAIFYLFYSQLCCSELLQSPPLVLYSPGDPEYTDVLVKRVHDNLTLVCELRGDPSLRTYVWNYVGRNSSGHNGDSRLLVPHPSGPTTSSTLQLTDLQLSDSGQYMCSVPPFSVTKYIVVQTKGPVQCARGAFWCGSRCVLLAYVCDGRRDCARGEDEDAAVCERDVCARPHKLNCTGGRCISAAACCGGGALCRQPACCDEYAPRAPDDDFPPLFDDRRAPDDYGFIQSTIYTVTACALIFMIAVVLLVSAICKMQMKRAALRGYAHAERATRAHYHRVGEPARPPPCYEAALLEAEPRELAELPRAAPGGRRAAPPRPAPAPYAADEAAAAAGARLNRAAREPERARLTLSLGRFRLSLPRRAPEPTYTLRGRTIRLLGAELAPAAPPPYCKARGPPPRYGAELAAEDAAAANVELPPPYEGEAPALGALLRGLPPIDAEAPALGALLRGLPPIDAELDADDPV